MMMNRLFLISSILFTTTFCIPLSGAEPEFDTATPEACGVKSEELRKLSEWVRKENLDIRSMVLLKNDKLVFEWYAGGVTRDHNHNIFSVTKSIVSTLTGIALADGKIRDLNMPLGKTLPRNKSLSASPKKSAITIENLLTMRSGFPISRANRQTGPERELFDQLNAAPDRSAASLALELATKPGGNFAYNNIDPQLVLSVIESVYRKKAFPLANDKLFSPLGFKNAQWVYPDQTGAVPGGYGIRLRAIDMAKIGQLYLREGKWMGKSILPQEFVRAATTDQTGTGYGYFWWIYPGGKSFAAKGVRGQQIFVDREKELVFVITADLPPARVQAVMKLLTDRVLSATAAKPLPEKPADFAALAKEIKTAADFIPPQRAKAPRARLPRIPRQ